MKKETITKINKTIKNFYTKIKNMNKKKHENINKLFFSIKKQIQPIEESNMEFLIINEKLNFLYVSNQIIKNFGFDDCYNEINKIKKDSSNNYYDIMEKIKEKMAFSKKFEHYVFNGLQIFKKFEDSNISIQNFCENNYEILKKKKFSIIRNEYDGLGVSFVLELKDKKYFLEIMKIENFKDFYENGLFLIHFYPITVIIEWLENQNKNKNIKKKTIMDYYKKDKKNEQYLKIPTTLDINSIEKEKNRKEKLFINKTKILYTSKDKTIILTSPC